MLRLCESGLLIGLVLYKLWENKSGVFPINYFIRGCIMWSSNTNPYWYINITPSKKMVRFHSLVSVCLIQSRADYEYSNISKDVWWSSGELEEIRKSILIDIQELRLQCPELSLADCQKHILSKTT